MGVYHETAPDHVRIGAPDDGILRRHHECQDPPTRQTPYRNPYTPPLPTIGLLLDILRSYGPKGTLIDTSNRDLALALGRSVSMITDLLRRLEADGHITRVTGTRGTLIEVLR